MSEIMATATAVEHGLTASEMEQAMLFLEQTRTGLKGALRNLSEAQWRFKPAPDRWSIGEIVQHIVDVQELVLGPIRDQLANSPLVPVHPDHKLVDEMIIARFPNRLTKFPSPIQPSGAISRDEALERVLTNYTRFNKYLESTPDLRQRAVESVPLKAISGGAYSTMDGYQWVLAMAAHTERHTKQILEVIAQANFPMHEAVA